MVKVIAIIRKTWPIGLVATMAGFIGLFNRLQILSTAKNFRSLPPLPFPPLPVVLLCLCLTGCGLFNPGPPGAVVEQAVAQKLAQTQSLLRSQLSGEDLAAATFEVGQVTVSSRHPVTLDHRSAVEVEGTYTLKGNTLNRSQRQQVRPFDIYLQRGADRDQWFLLEPNPGETPPQWQAISLTE
jgi:hypothetical protein